MGLSSRWASRPILSISCRVHGLRPGPLDKSSSEWDRILSSWMEKRPWSGSFRSQIMILPPHHVSVWRRGCLFPCLTYYMNTFLFIIYFYLTRLQQGFQATYRYHCVVVRRCGPTPLLQTTTRFGAYVSRHARGWWICYMLCTMSRSYFFFFCWKCVFAHHPIYHMYSKSMRSTIYVHVPIWLHPMLTWFFI